MTTPDTDTYMPDPFSMVDIAFYDSDEDEDPDLALPSSPPPKKENTPSPNVRVSLPAEAVPPPVETEISPIPKEKRTRNGRKNETSKQRQERRIRSRRRKAERRKAEQDVPRVRFDPEAKSWSTYIIAFPLPRSRFHTYVGITTRSAHRLRAHNLEIAGGARCTTALRKNHPSRHWQYVLRITGADMTFNKQLEWLLHRPAYRGKEEPCRMCGRIVGLGKALSLERVTNNARRTAVIPLQVCLYGDNVRSCCHRSWIRIKAEHYTYHSRSAVRFVTK